MPIVGGLVEHVHQAGFDARGVFGRKPQRLGDPVCGFETDAIDISCQAIGIGLHNVQGFIAILFINLDRQVGAHPMTVQEKHDLLDLLLLFPGGGDQPGPFGTDIRHFTQAPGLCFDHFQGLLAKMLHDALRQARANPTDQPGAQVTANARHGGGQGVFANLDFELQSVFGVVDPAAAQADILSWDQLRQVAGDGCQPLIAKPAARPRNLTALRAQAQHAIPIFRVIKRDTLDRTG